MINSYSIIPRILKYHKNSLILQDIFYNIFRFLISNKAMFHKNTQSFFYLNMIRKQFLRNIKNIMKKRNFNKHKLYISNKHKLYISNKHKLYILPNVIEKDREYELIIS